MEDKLRKYIDDLFNGTTPTRKAVELKEEMILNLHDKYNDLTAEGKTPEAAYNIAIAGIGDVSGLFRELEAEATATAPDAHEYELANRKSAMLTAIAVMMYILSVLPLIMLFQITGRLGTRVGIPIMFVMIACATGLLVYNSMTKPKQYRNAESLVDEFREWQTDTHEKKSLRKAISAALWTVITALYFIISFATFAWHVTWIIFLIAAAIESFINIFFTLKKR